MPLGQIVDVMGGATPSKERPSLWDGTIPWVSPKDMKRPVLRDTEDHVSDDALKQSALRLVPPPAVLTVVRGMILAHSVPIALTEAPVTLNQDMKALLPRSGLSARFLAWSLRAFRDGLLSLVEEAGHGTKRLRTDLWKRFLLPLPPTLEQRAIADFLDRKTSAIDALIEKKERLIALLQEKRQALITQAVTRGLDPTVSMKDSGIEWLEQIPAHWEVAPVRYLLRSIEQGWSPQCENRRAAADEWGVLKAGCVNGWRFRPSENKALPPDLDPIRRYEVREGDLIMSRANTRDLLGSVALVRDCPPRRLLCDKLYRLTARLDRALPEFLELALSARAARFQMEREATGASGSMQNIGQDTVQRIVLACPPPDEQQRIVEQVRMQSQIVELAEQQLSESTERLREYRQVLIAAAVTGKLDIPAPEAA